MIWLHQPTTLLSTQRFVGFYLKILLRLNDPKFHGKTLGEENSPPPVLYQNSPPTPNKFVSKIKRFYV